jgi:Rad3-related DNA helicase
MNKVLQAAGRVIRTEEDTGVVALLDNRFLQSSYRSLFPREWNDVETVTTQTVNNAISEFWARLSQTQD